MEQTTTTTNATTDATTNATTDATTNATTDAGTVTVVVGAAGADVQPVVAHLAGEVADGLAVRVISTDPDLMLSLDSARHRRMLPTAAGNTDANLAIVGPWARGYLHVDVLAAEDAGLKVRHRLTLHPRVRRSFRDVDQVSAHELGEVGDVAAQARDAVLRAGGHVLIEADDPTGRMTVVQALVDAGIPPWATYVQDLTIWIVASADVPQLDDAWLQRIGDTVRLNGGPPPLPGNVSMMIALTGIEEHWPAVAGFDLESFTARVREAKSVTAGGVRAANMALMQLRKRVEEATGVPVKLVTTGPVTAIDLR